MTSNPHQAEMPDVAWLDVMDALDPEREIIPAYRDKEIGVPVIGFLNPASLEGVRGALEKIQRGERILDAEASKLQGQEIFTSCPKDIAKQALSDLNRLMGDAE